MEDRPLAALPRHVHTTARLPAGLRTARRSRNAAQWVAAVCAWSNRTAGQPGCALRRRSGPAAQHVHGEGDSLMGDRIIGRLDTLSPEEKRALLARLYAGQVQKPKTAPLSLAQERVLSLCQMEPQSPGYNITTAYRLNGPLDAAALEQALNQI